MWSSPCRRDGEVEKSALRAVTFFLLRRKAWLEVELPLAKGRRRDSKNITLIFLGKPLSFSTQKDFQSPSILQVSHPSRKD